MKHTQTRLPEEEKGERSLLVRLAGLVALTLMLSPLPAYAHVNGAMTGGFQSGLVHPVQGADHLLAMLAVGLWGAQMGGRTVWTLPMTFPMVMAVGSLLGMAGIALPGTELGISASMIVLGLCIVMAWKPDEVIALAIISVFAIFHGHAHGVELPQAAEPSAYAMGFVSATGAIHVAGVGIGLAINNFAHGRVTRALGLAIALAGVYFALRSLWG